MADFLSCPLLNPMLATCERARQHLMIALTRFIRLFSLLTPRLMACTVRLRQALKFTYSLSEAGYKAGRARAIFELPSHLSYIYPGKLVYIEHFRPFSSSCPNPHRLYSTSLAMVNCMRMISIIPLSSIRMACHLVPRYHLMDVEQQISSSDDLLTTSKHCYFNKYASHFIFALTEHWRQRQRTVSLFPPH